MMLVDLLAVCRLPSVLLRDAPGDVQESDELARDAHLPSRSAYIREGQRPHPQARALRSYLNDYLTLRN